MNILQIKRNLENLDNKKIVVKVNLGRNKHEKYIGTIDKMYPSLFTLKTENNIKSFSYVDLLTKEISITEL